LIAQHHRVFAPAGNPDRMECPRRSKPAHCAWHVQTFRDAFPPRCPYSTPDPLATLARMQDAAWGELVKSYADPSADRDVALDLLDQKETCTGCLECGLAHPVVRRLRRKVGLSA
jgi:hypothetical protein